MAERPFVYLDIAFLLNFALDYVILRCASRFGNWRCSRGRLITGAVAGGLYGIFVFWPAGTVLYTLPGKILFSALLVVLVFWPLNLKKFFLAWVYFYIFTFLIGGAALGVIYLLFSPGMAWPVKFPTRTHLVVMVAATLVGLFLARGCFAWMQRNVIQRWHHLQAAIYLQGQTLTVNGLVDTGNNLREPLSGLPVLVVEEQVLLPLLPVAVRRLLTDGETDPMKIAAAFAESNWAARLRLIPFTAVGTRSGLMVGIRPDYVILREGNRLIQVEKVIIGLSNRRLSPEQSYQALIHPELLGVA